MFRRIFACVAGVIILYSSPAASQTHAEICVPATIGGKNVLIVSKAKLAKKILNQNSDAQVLYINTESPAAEGNRGPLWLRIFIDDRFCIGNPACIGLNPETRKNDTVAAEKVLTRLRNALANFIFTQTTTGGFYSTANPGMGEAYLMGSNAKNPIYCTGPDLPPVIKPAPGISAGAMRLRANADDLGIDASVDKSLFKPLKPATVNLSRDGVANKKTINGQAALGFAVPLNFAGPADAPYFRSEVVPYIAATQSYSKVDGKTRTLGDKNNLAVGALFDTSVVFATPKSTPNAPSVNNVFMIKPQYLWNTKDHSEIASIKAIWQPWTQGVRRGDLQLNSEIPMGPYSAQFLFDLRFNSGTYTNKGNDPATMAQHDSFNRGGSKFGLAFSTPATGPYATLRLTETLLEGFSGQARHISLFEGAWSYYFDSTGNLAFTISYTNGRDEDTAEYAQTYTVGLSAKF